MGWELAIPCCFWSQKPCLSHWWGGWDLLRYPPLHCGWLYFPVLATTVCPLLHSFLNCDLATLPSRGGVCFTTPWSWAGPGIAGQGLEVMLCYSQAEPFMGLVALLSASWKSATMKEVCLYPETTVLWAAREPTGEVLQEEMAHGEREKPRITRHQTQNF